MSLNLLYVNIILFLLWILTIIALLHYIKKISKNKNQTNPTEIFISLITQKHNELVETKKKLIEISNFLKIGLIEIVNKKIVELNEFDKILSINNVEKEKVLNEIENISLVSDNREIKTLILNSIVLQLNILKFSDTHALIIIQDVTKIYNLGVTIKEKEKLILLGKIAGQIAHQIKTQLAILAGKAQLLYNHPLILSDNNLCQNLYEIYLKSKEISERINEIVSIYKGKNIQKRHFNLFNLLTELIHDHKKNLPEFEFNLNIDKNLSIFSDPIVFKNIINIILENSLHPETEATKIEFDAYKQNNQTIIKITDNGIGVKDDLKQKIFEPFFSTRKDGLGLGLYLAKDLANLLDIDLLPGDTEKGFQIILKIQDEYHADSAQDK